MLEITKQKDDLLRYICAQENYYAMFNVSYELLPIKDKNRVDGIMSGFLDQGLLKEFHPIQSSHIQYRLSFKATDFLLKGGFEAQEEIFKANIDALSFQIDRLKPKLGDDAVTLLNLVANLTSAASSFWGFI